MPQRILRQHFSQLRDQMLSYFDHLGLAEHGDVKGLAREGFVRQFLARNLPTAVEFKTGEMIDHEDRRSGQLDVVLQMPSAPRVNLHEDIQLTLVGGSVGAIEVKSTLTTADFKNSSHLKSALEASSKVKALNRFEPISATVVSDRIDLERTPFFIFAYDGCSKDTLIEKVRGYGGHAGLELEQYAPDLVVCLKQGYYMARDNGWLWPSSGKDFVFWEGAPEECLCGLFVYISQLIQAYNRRPPFTQLGMYFNNNDEPQ